MNALTLSGKSDAKGRNGYYKLASVEVWKFHSVTDGDCVYVDFRSKHGNASARLCLTAEDYGRIQAFLPPLKEVE